MYTYCIKGGCIYRVKTFAKLTLTVFENDNIDLKPLIAFIKLKVHIIIYPPSSCYLQKQLPVQDDAGIFGMHYILGVFVFYVSADPVWHIIYGMNGTHICHGP